MAPADLLRPLEGQREETLRLLDSLSEDELAREVREADRTCRDLFAHLAASDHRAVTLFKLALNGDVVHMSDEDRERQAQEHEQAVVDWDLPRLRLELADSRRALRDLFGSMEEEDLDREVRWPDWPARSIRSSIPYMLEHEDAHLDQVRKAVEKD